MIAAPPAFTVDVVRRAGEAGRRWLDSPKRVQAWSLVRCLDYWLWGLAVGDRDNQRKASG
jgi:hypothetical protein